MKIYSLAYWEFKTDGSDSKTYGVGPAVRYYFGKDTIYPFVAAEYDYTRNDSEDSYAGLSSKTTGHGNQLSLGLGVDYFLSRNVAVEPIIRYTFSHDNANTSSLGSTISSNDRTGTFFAGIGINAFIF